MIFHFYIDNGITVYLRFFDIRNKQMFTKARAFSRITFFFIFWRARRIFFLNLHSEISYLTPFSETVQRDDTNFGPFPFSLEIRETAAGNFPFGKEEKQPANTKETAFFIHCYATCLSQTIWCT